MDDEDTDDEPEPIKKRQMNVLRDTIKSVVGAPVKFFTNGRLIKGVQMAIQSQRIPKPGSGSTVDANGASNIIGTIFQTMRKQWAKNSVATSTALRKQLQTITKRLSNSKVIIGNLVGTSHKMTNREESATKEATADLVATPTAETKTLVKKKSERNVDLVSNHFLQPYPYQMMAVPPPQYYQAPIANQQQQHLAYQMPVYPEMLL